MSGGNVIQVGSAEAFDSILGKVGSTPVFIDFTATWCGPCKVIGPIFDGLAKENPKSVFLKVDVDERQELAKRYNISAMPTFVFLKQSEEVQRLKGPTPAELKSAIASHAA